MNISGLIMNLVLHFRFISGAIGRYITAINRSYNNDPYVLALYVWRQGLP